MISFRIIRLIIAWLSIENSIVSPVLIIAVFIHGLSRIAIAQIIPDHTLPNPSIVNLSSNQAVLTGGTEVGKSLFHSFSQFSIPTNGTAYFNNAPQIQTIFTRITGNLPSSIDGLIQTNGGTNLFLLNPNGILFGPNARLEIGGSFTASTADRLTFSDGQIFSALNPQQIPLLTLRVPLGIQLGQPTPGSTIANTATLSVPENLTLQADRLNLSGQLKAGKEVTLQAIDTVQIRDRITQPFMVQSGGTLTIEGGNTIDIFALNHPGSLLSATHNLVLRSANPVIGDAHFNSGGNFRIEDLKGRLGQLVSPHDPVIRSTGNVSFVSYQGASLHIFAGGSVIIPEGIVIDSADSVNGIVETVPLSDGTRFSIDGRAEPTVDIRAGMKPEAIGAVTALSSTIPSRADITIGSITINSDSVSPRIGSVLLTNQFQPNLALSGGDIQITKNKINAVAINQDGLQLAIDSRGSLTLNYGILGSSIFRNAGDAKILTQGDVYMPFIRNISNSLNGGNVAIVAGGAINLPGGVEVFTTGTGDGGTVNLSAQGNITTRWIDTSGGTEGKGGDIAIDSRNGTIRIENGRVFSPTYGKGDAGRITLTAGQDIVVRVSDIHASSVSAPGGNGQDITLEAGGSIFIKTSSFSNSVGNEQTPLSANNKNFIRFASPEIDPYSKSIGNAGIIRLDAKHNITGIDSALYSNIIYDSRGNAGKIEVSAGNDVTWEGTPSSGWFWIYSGFYAFSRGIGNAGDIIIHAQNLNLLNANIEAGMSFLAIGKLGNIKIQVQDQMLLDGKGWLTAISNPIKPSGYPVIALGEKGGIQIEAGSLIMRNGSEISTAVGDIDPFYVAGGTATGNAGDIDIQVRGDVSLSQSFISSRVFANGTGNAGKINLNARSLTGYQAIIVSDTAGKGDANTINLTTTQGMYFEDSNVSSAVQPRGVGQAKDITLNARSLVLVNGAQINTLNSGQGTAGNVFVNADDVSISGINLIRTPENFLYAKQLNLSADDFIVVSDPIPTGILYAKPISRLSSKFFAFTTAPDFLDGVSSGIFSSTSTINKGGNITINARSVNVGSGGQIDARTTNDGVGGTIQINSNQVQLTDGGQLSAITSGQGKGGTIGLNSDQILISGHDSTFFDRLALFGTKTDIYGKAKVSNQGPNSGIFANTESKSTGMGGTVSIVSGDVLVANNGQISVDSQGLGDGGKIWIDSNTLSLDRGNILAKTRSGEGGNIALTIQDLLSLRRNSQISATASATGNGGNIEINAANGFIVSLLNEDNDITANAFQGRGGNIKISTQAAFGILHRSNLTPFSDITASSDLGISGTVTIKALEPEPKQTVEELTQLVDTANQISQTCSPKARSNSFVTTGKGGLPPDPYESLNATEPWRSPTSTIVNTNTNTNTNLNTNINTNINSNANRSHLESRLESSLNASPIVEASSWIKQPDGTVVLTSTRPVRSQALTCPAGVPSL